LPRQITIDVPVDPNARPAIGNKPTATSGTMAPGAPWAICITPAPNQALYSSDGFPGPIYKLTLDGKVLGVFGKSGKQLGQFDWIHEWPAPPKTNSTLPKSSTGASKNWYSSRFTSILDGVIWERTIQSIVSRSYRGFRRPCVSILVASMGITFGCLPLRAQEAPQAITTDEATPQSSASNAAERDVTYRTLPRNLLQDQKDIWLFPVRLTKGHQWLPTLAVTGVTAALIVADPHDTGYFRRTSSFHTFNNVFSGPITAGEIAVVPAAFLVVGHFTHNSYAEKTALLAGEAYVDSAVLDVVLKVATRRLRPSDIPPTGPFNDTFFNSRVSNAGIDTSFPSSHASAAFAVATVFAHRYRHHRWVPYVAYGAASLISFSRVTNQAHFPSDVILGAALGFAISEFSVLRQR
jgi:membrane-associated phospholipid phosphatase